MLSNVFRGAVPSPDLSLFMSRFPSDASQSSAPVSWSEVKSAYEYCLADIKSQSDRHASEIGSAANYASYDELQLATKKHRRTDKGPKDTLVGPLTAVQEYGWNAHEFVEKKTILGKKSCAETIYASELIKSGVFY